VRAFYPALGQPQTKGNTAQFCLPRQPLQRRSTPEHTTLFAQDRP